MNPCNSSPDSIVGEELRVGAQTCTPTLPSPYLFHLLRNTAQVNWKYSPSSLKIAVVLAIFCGILPGILFFVLYCIYKTLHSDLKQEVGVTAPPHSGSLIEDSLLEADKGVLLQTAHTLSSGSPPSCPEIQPFIETKNKIERTLEQDESPSDAIEQQPRLKHLTESLRKTLRCQQSELMQAARKAIKELFPEEGEIQALATFKEAFPSLPLYAASPADAPQVSDEVILNFLYTQRTVNDLRNKAEEAVLDGILHEQHATNPSQIKEEEKSTKTLEQDKKRDTLIKQQTCLDAHVQSLSTFFNCQTAELIQAAQNANKKLLCREEREKQALATFKEELLSLQTRPWMHRAFFAICFPTEVILECLYAQIEADRLKEEVEHYKKSQHWINKHWHSFLFTDPKFQEEWGKMSITFTNSHSSLATIVAQPSEKPDDVLQDLLLGTLGDKLSLDEKNALKTRLCETSIPEKFWERILEWCSLFAEGHGKEDLLEQKNLLLSTIQTYLLSLLDPSTALSEKQKNDLQENNFRLVLSSESPALFITFGKSSNGQPSIISQRTICLVSSSQIECIYEWKEELLLSVRKTSGNASRYEIHITQTRRQATGSPPCPSS